MPSTGVSTIIDEKSSVALIWMVYESEGGTVGSQENSSFNSGDITLGINIEKNTVLHNLFLPY